MPRWLSRRIPHEAVGSPTILRASEELVRAGDIARDAGDPARAAELYRRAASLQPGRDDLRVQLGNMLKDSGQFEDAVHAYDDGLRLRASGDTHLQRGRALRLAGRLAEARAGFAEALRLDPDLLDAAIEFAKLPPKAKASGSQAQGAVERREGDVVTGFAFDPASPHTPVGIEVRIDGARLTLIVADAARPDLAALCPGLVGGGFSLRLPPKLDEAVVELRIVGAIPLVGGWFRASTSTRRYSQAYATYRAAEGQRTALILSVSGPPAAARADIEALFRATENGAARHLMLILVEPGEVHPSLAAPLADLAAGAAREGRSMIRIAARRGEGLVARGNRAVAAAEGCDVIWLSPGARVGPGWLAGLRAAAYTRVDIAGAAALAVAEGPFALLKPEENPTALGGCPSAQAAEAAIVRASRQVRRNSGAHLPAVPAAQSSCFYYRADALARLGLFDAEAFPVDMGAAHLDWCLRAFGRGLEIVLDDRTYASPARTSEEAPSSPEATDILAARYAEFEIAAGGFARDPLVIDVRRRLVAALKSAVSVEIIPPRALFVVSTLTGGTPLTNRDLMAALNGSVEAWLLHCDGTVLRLFNVSSEEDRLDASHILSEPINFTSHRSGEYDEIVWTWLLDRGFEIVHIRHLAWHGLALPALASGLGIPTVLSFHDFYAACPTVKLIDGDGRHCGGACTDSPTPCVPDLWPGAVHPPLKHRFVYQWRAKFAQAIAPCLAFVTTSASTRDLLVKAFPQLETARFAIISHGRDYPALKLPEPQSAYAGERKLRLLTIGNLTPAKGRDLIEALLEADRGVQFEVHVLGECDLLDRPGLHRHGPYRRDDLPSLLQELNADVGLVLSIWPETWCHALTEMWAAGLPAVTLDFGATAERVRDSGAGWVLERPDPQLLLDLLSTLVGAPERLSEAAEAARAWRRGEGARLTTAAMAARYGELYVEIGAKLDIAGIF